MGGDIRRPAIACHRQGRVMETTTPRPTPRPPATNTWNADARRPHAPEFAHILKARHGDRAAVLVGRASRDTVTARIVWEGPDNESRMATFDAFADLVAEARTLPVPLRAPRNPAGTGDLRRVAACPVGLAHLGDPPQRRPDTGPALTLCRDPGSHRRCGVRPHHHLHVGARPCRPPLERGRQPARDRDAPWCRAGHPASCPAAGPRPDLPRPAPRLLRE